MTGKETKPWKRKINETDEWSKYSVPNDTEHVISETGHDQSEKRAWQTKASYTKCFSTLHFYASDTQHDNNEGLKRVTNTNKTCTQYNNEQNDQGSKKPGFF